MYMTGRTWDDLSRNLAGSVSPGVQDNCYRTLHNIVHGL